MKSTLNKYVGNVLSLGVILSFVVLAWGSILYINNPQTGGRPGGVLHILRGALQLDPVATINLGLLILLLTPVARVITAMVGFWMERDRKYAAVSFVVLMVILLSAVLGKG